MKRLFIVLCFGLSAFVASAQPELYLGNGTVDPGEDVCIPVYGRFFTDIVTIQFSVNFDPELLDFTGVQNFGVPGSSAADFDVTQAADGKIGFSWQDDMRDCFSSNGGNPSFTIENDGILFEICFTAKASAGYGDVSVIDISGDPEPLLTHRIGAIVTATECNNLGFINIDPGLVSFQVRPLQVNIVQIEDNNANPGDLVCVDFTATGFDNLQSMQFNIVWDSTVMELENIVPNGNIPNNGNVSSNFGFGGNIRANRLTYNWLYTNLSEPNTGITQPDGVQLFEVCFRLLDDACGESSSVSIVDYPTLGIEVTNADQPGFNIFFESNEGEVQVNDCDPQGIQVTVDCGDPDNPDDAVNLNDEICIPIRAGDNYDRVSSLEFILKWSSSILEYKNINIIAPFWTMADFDASNAANGFLGVAWDNSPTPPQDLNPGDIIFEICYDVIGLGGNSPVNISKPWRGRSGNGPNIGVNPINCEVNVIQPPGLTMAIGDGTAGPGDNFCVDFDVFGFQDIDSLNFSLAFDPGLFQFAGVQNINIPEAGPGNFSSSAAGSGSLFFNWNSATGQSLPDQTSAFQVCFTPLGDPGDCGLLQGVDDLPFQLFASDVASGDENIGLTIDPGELCTLFPDGFGLNIAEAEGDWLDTACVRVSVVEFDNISATNFCVSWDPSSLEYTGINFTGLWDGLTEANVDVSSANVGLLCFDWNGNTPLAIADDSDVFELCFKMIGDALECYDIELQENPAPTVTTANGPGSIIPTNGSLCVNDKFYITDTLIIPASCPEACDGSVEITVIGGQGQLGTLWFTQPNNQFSPLRAQNLCPGPLTFRVSDSNSPSLVEEFTIEIPLAEGVPTANAGDDLLLGCDPQSVLLSGSGSEGDVYSYQWFRLNSVGDEVPIAPSSSSVVELVPGTKIFKVTNTETSCTAADTMMVIPRDVPLADAGGDLEFTCAEDDLLLDGSGSESDGVTYSWRSLNNGVIAAGQETLVNPRVEAPGSYILRVAFEDTGCFSTDTVRVIDSRVEPDVVAGQDKILDCALGSVTLTSLSNNPDLDVSFEWYDQNNQLLGIGETFEATQLGNYILFARDNASNCTSSDTVSVLPDANYPAVVIDPVLPFTCVRDSVLLGATVGPDTISYTFSWTASAGGLLVPGSDTTLMPTALSPGTYTLAVTNTTSNCTAEIDVIIDEDLTPPTAAAGEDQTITCQESTVTLTGAGSDTGDGFTYLWTNMEGDTVGMSFSAEVSAPGTYTLQVTSLENGCTATDEVDVLLDGDVPQVTIAGAQDINCEVTAINLSGNVTPAGPAYEYQWIQYLANDVFNEVGDGTPNLEVTMAGVYVLEVTNPADGCVGSNQVTVNLNNQPPLAEAGAPTQMITCDTATVTLSAEASVQGPEYSYEWSNVDPPFNTSQTIEVSTPNIYQLTVRNNETGCIATDEVEVLDGQQLPVLSFSMPNPALDCINTTIDVEGLVQGATDLSVTWTGLDGGTPEPSDALTTTISQAGNYRLVVENNLTGCVDSLDLTVVDNSGNPPVVSIAEPIPFTCTTPTITLDAGATGAITDFSSVSWTSLDGNTVTPATGALQVAVDGPGTYELTVVDANTGCAGTSSVIVIPDNDTPVAAAGADLGIECDETGILDGLGSSQGVQFTSQWVNLGGGATPMPADDLESSVTEPGSYLLIISNTDNGCVDTDTVQVNRIFPEDAAAGNDISLCQDQTAATLSANQPAGTSGIWTSGGTATLDAAADPNSGVAALQSGSNVFTWTLSAPGCPDYSQDQVTVFIETAPIAVEDLLIVNGEQRSVSINLAQNDVLTNVDAYEVTLQGAPEFGTIDSFVNGRVYYSVPRGFVGTTEVPYEICNLDCPDLCATGILRINVSDPDFEPTIMNTITPNGDGMNDELIFDVLLFTPSEDFPDNEIIIFNRWGDIVFQQRPYNNNWGGLNSNGDLLPQGTYYYILRLNLADGVIIRGDVTIIDGGGR